MKTRVDSSSRKLAAVKATKSILKWTAIGVITAVFLAPPLWLVLTSFKYPIEAMSIPPTFLPHEPTLRAYTTLFTGRDPRGYIMTPIITNFINSTVVGLVTTFFSLVLGLGAAYSIARGKVKGGLAIFAGILLMRTIPKIALAIPFFTWLKTLRLTDTLVGLVIVHITLVFPLVMFIMYNFFRRIPSELEDAAMVDGCSPGAVFIRIVLPLSAPAITVSAIISFIFSYNEFLYALVFLSTNTKMTIPISLGFFVTQRGVDWDLMSAAGVLALVPMIVLFLLIQKYIISGLTTGALKE